MNLIPQILILVVFLNAINASNILVLLPMASKSHKNVFDPLIEAMALRNHKLTVISTLATSKNPNVKEIVPVPLEIVYQAMDNCFEIRRKGRLNFFASLNTTHFQMVCHKMYQNEQVQNLMREETFDLVIMNGIANECAYGLANHVQAPIIFITTLPAPSGIAEKVGNHLPSSFVPSPFFTFTDRMTFKERAINMLVNALSHYFLTTTFERNMEKIYKQYLGPQIPSVAEIDKRLSLIFMNSHLAMTYPRPLLPNVIEVGGMHCRPVNPKNVPKEIDDFVSGAEHGFILFSLGSIVKAHQMPEETKKAFINVFSKLKQRVIWKWEADLPDLPPNVMISKWLPQQDLLGHKNIRLFITHGGLLSTQEAVYHGVPLVGFPIFADQDLNMKQAENSGFCLSLEIIDLDEKKLESTLQRVLNEPMFTQKAKELSAIYRDQQQTSLERAVFWTEYILRHKGAPHLQSPARDLNFIQYHSIDVVSFLIAILLLTIWLSKLFLWNVLVKRIICRSSKSVKSLKSKKQN